MSATPARQTVWKTSMATRRPTRFPTSNQPQRRHRPRLLAVPRGPISERDERAASSATAAHTGVAAPSSGEITSSLGGSAAGFVVSRTYLPSSRSYRHATCTARARWPGVRQRGQVLSISRGDGATLWAGVHLGSSQTPAPLGDGVHAGDGHGDEQRGQDEYEDDEGADRGHGSLTFLHEAEQSESVWALGDSA